MPKERVKGAMQATVSAKVIRADGTEEDLGIISVTDVEADRIVAAIREASPEDEAPQVDAEARNRAESEANQAETLRLAKEDAKRYDYQQES